MDAAKVSAAREEMLKKYGKQEEKVADKSEMNKDMFLNLLVTQMQYQDPLEPTKNEDFLAQMAQFSALEQMKNLNTGFMMQQGNNLIGKVVSGKIVDETTGNSTEIAGVVKSIRLQDSEVYLLVQDEKQNMHELKLSKVAEVGGDVDNYLQKTSLDTINETLKGIDKRLDALSKKVEEKEKEDKKVEATEGEDGKVAETEEEKVEGSTKTEEDSEETAETEEEKVEEATETSENNG